MLRWCLFSPLDMDVNWVILLARTVPLPFEALWFVSFNAASSLDPWLRGPAHKRALLSSGRMQLTSDVDVVLKATALDSVAYHANKRKLLAAKRARRDLNATAKRVEAALKHVDDASASGGDVDDAMAALLAAQTRYARLKQTIRADGTIRAYLVGKRERQARRKLGLLDERDKRHYERLRLLAIGDADPHSLLHKCPTEVLDEIKAYLGPQIVTGHAA